MNYEYDINQECFIREDGLGKKFFINSTEAHRIMNMYNLGNSIGEIRNKISFRNPSKVTESTIKNFINNVIVMFNILTCIVLFVPRCNTTFF